MTIKRCAYGLLLVLNILIVYSNHFGNDFQFDDVNAVERNPAIRHPETIVRAFADPALFSAAPEQRNYRPVTTASLALDYWLAGGLNVFFFHLSTLLWFALQTVLMFLLFEHLMNLADPHPSNMWSALAAAALFGVHPVNAETLNFIIQRGEVFNAAGCVAALWIFARYPSQRRYGWYLLPAALAMLAKAPALVFPLLLFAYIVLFETAGAAARAKWKAALRACLPAFALAALAGTLLYRMQSAAWHPGAESPAAYRFTQPYVILHYFASFFVPTGLNVDRGWHYVSPWSLPAAAGYLFLLTAITAWIAAARVRAARPIAFGLAWFLISLAPTSLMPLGDVTNDHRMFFAFVGLTLAVVWGLRLALLRQTARFTRRRGWARAAVAAFSVVLIAAGVATRVRNRVWLTKESLWSDAVAKNPDNPRALTNYGAVVYEEGDYQAAVRYWQRALSVAPAYSAAQVNLVRAASKLHRSDLAEHYLREIAAAHPSNPAGYAMYADWLASEGRFDEAIPMLDRARRLDPQSPELKRARLSAFQRRDAADRILLFRILDADHDSRISTGEIVAAPAALRGIDRNGDGKLTADECGAASADPAERARFVRTNPLFSALDADHDGEISSSEMAAADRVLARLDRNGDGVLEEQEMVPGYVRGAAFDLMRRLDRRGEGRIGVAQFDREPLRSLLLAADADADGSVTLEELTNELVYRADRDKDGVVTPQEWSAAARSLAIPVAAERAAAEPARPRRAAVHPLLTH